MKVNGKPTRTIWLDPEAPEVLCVIDQLRLPHRFEVARLHNFQMACDAISRMLVRGAGLIGATAGYGMYLGALELKSTAYAEEFRLKAQQLIATRPTAANLAHAVQRQLSLLSQVQSRAELIERSRQLAEQIADEDAESCRKIGQHGLALLQELAAKKPGQVINVLTHCNAGWLAFVDYGSATSPIYAAHEAGIPLHVWVDETRPRNQGASLTAWELGQQGVPHTLIADNTGGHLMQHGLVDFVIVGSDRVSRDGDVANKIGTYLKALAARDNQLPFYVALPSTTFDFSLRDGVKNIPIEERGSEEVRFMEGVDAEGAHRRVLICPEGTPAKNYGFDVTPARLVTGLICERGICAASEPGILGLFPEQQG